MLTVDCVKAGVKSVHACGNIVGGAKPGIVRDTVCDLGDETSAGAGSARAQLLEFLVHRFTEWARWGLGTGNDE